MIGYYCILNLCISSLKLIVYFYFGEKVFTAFNEMKKKLEDFTLSENVSNHDWRQYIAIKGMKYQFNFSVINLIKIQRETALIVGSFILQYAVILIQTSI
jgi:hypothetical protein